ncbi:hypothetical protein SanaruYs_17790 [Chryseotalea sanaruensis]|uniref:Uncharacterized protein n=1 Tax=Chryseotalea sanaruensis TaxID=2482724 RepID=A0A401U9M8_9BACT|nr:hypothetical protein [Chryseotalea sanaruensis]GCC51554.1 hypothetical protein SanaruYs_17790 [Chryseotalea sanaruensis]
MKIEKQLIKKDNPDYQIIGDAIKSVESVVGIDAKHTHILIINKLLELDKKLDKISKQLNKKMAKKKKQK